MCGLCVKGRFEIEAVAAANVVEGNLPEVSKSLCLLLCLLLCLCLF